MTPIIYLIGVDLFLTFEQTDKSFFNCPIFSYF